LRHRLFAQPANWKRSPPLDGPPVRGSHPTTLWSGNARVVHHSKASGRIEALTGLRMMPTFPRSPLSFRTAGFPQYGCKAGFPSGAFPGRRRLKLAPGILRPTSGLHPPFVRLVVGALPGGVQSSLRPDTVGSFPACCARATSGQGATAPPSSVMNSRRSNRSSDIRSSHGPDHLRQDIELARIGQRMHWLFTTRSFRKAAPCNCR
jgi:hypothetical protein